MGVNREELTRIKEVLKANPRGMNVLEISRAIKMHRQSVAKYLEMLAISGHVDMKTFGPAKVYYISQRLPISSMLSLSSDLIVILNKDMRIINVNDRFLEFINAKREEVLNKDFTTISPAFDFEPSIMPNIAEALSGKESAIDAYFKHKGNERFFSVKFIPMVFEEGQQGATILMEDVTKERLIDLTIRESEEKLRSIIEQSSDGIIITDEKGIIIDYNKSQEAIIGIGAEQALGKFAWDILYPLMPEDRRDDKAYKRYQSAWKELLKGMRPVDRYQELEIQRQDGTRHMIQVSVTPIQSEKGFMAVASFRDVSDHKAMEGALQESEEKLNIIMEKLHAGVAIYQGEGIVDVSRAVEWMTGYTREEMLKMKFWDLTAPEFRDMVRQRGLARQKGEQPPAIYECRLSSKGGESKWVELNAGYIKYKGEPAGLITFFDISGRKVTEEKLKESEALFAHTQHIAGMGSWRWDLISDRVSVSEEAYRIVGAPVGDQFITLDKFLSFVHPDDRAKSLSKIYEALHMKGKLSGDIRIIRNDGAERTLRIEEEVVYDDAGKPVAMYGVMQDTTEDRRMNEEWSNLVDRLKETNDQLSMIMYVSESVVNAQSLEDTLLSILQRLVQAMSADAGAILLKENDRITVKASMGFDEASLAKLSVPASKGFSGTITASGELLYIEDLQSDTRSISPLLKELGFKTIVGVPIKDRMEIVGVLQIEWRDVHSYKKVDIDVMNIIADRCSAAIINAMLYRKNKKLQLQSQYKTVKGF